MRRSSAIWSRSDAIVRSTLLDVVKSWHEADWIASRRLRVDGFSIVDHPRSRQLRRSDLSVNHGGVIQCAVPGEQMTPITIDCPMTAMEVVGGHINVGRCAMIVVVVCRHGSDAMQSEFYDELSLVFAVVTMLHIPVYT
jgi:hypothetical protein